MSTFYGTTNATMLMYAKNYNLMNYYNNKSLQIIVIY